MDEHYIIVADLLRRIRQERAALAQLWQGLSEAQMTQRPGPQESWSVKDLIAHIVFWEDVMRDQISKALKGEAISYDGSVDDANAEAYATYRDLPLADVLAEFGASLPRVEDFVRGLSDRQINDVEVCQIFGHPVRYIIAANTTVHYADHLDDLRAYVDRLPPPQTRSPSVPPLDGGRNSHE